MSAVERMASGIDAGGPEWVGLAAAGWLVALLTALTAVWQSARVDRIGRRAAEAAHELRGPVCAARLALGSLERAFADAPRVTRGTAAIDLELRRAGLVLDELGSVTSAGIRAARRACATGERVDVMALAAAAEPAWQALAALHGTTLTLRTRGGPSAVAGDSRRLAQALGNLVANACEHGRGPVVVTATGGDGVARVKVADGGCGPSAAVMRSARRRAKGLWRSGPATLRGHGMAVAARVAHEGRGRLHASADSEGAVVVLELPLEGSVRRPARPGTALAPAAGAR